MCDAFLQRYSEAINNSPDINTDIIPTIILFSEPNCTGMMSPTDGKGGFTTNTLTENSNVNIPFTPKSLYIPFNFQQVTISNGTEKSDIIGPMTITDVKTTYFTSNPNIPMDTLNQIEIKKITNWENVNVYNQCMGRGAYIGLFYLNRFQPQSFRCDTFMTQYCSKPENINSDACACFKELPDIIQKSEELKVELPVICFGEKCSTLNSYKTRNMLSNPCNLTICQQIINQSPGIINDTQTSVYCSGQFYTKSDNAITTVIPNTTTTVTVVVPATNQKTTNQTSIYSWVILGISGLLFLLLIFLLFSKPEKYSTNKKKDNEGAKNKPILFSN